MLISCFLPFVLAAFLYGSCINPISGEYEIPAISVTINPATEAVIIFKNTTSSEKKTKVWVSPASSEYYETTIGPHSSYVVTQTDSDGKVVPKRFSSGNHYFSVEGTSLPAYTVAAFGVTYITISDATIDSGGGLTTIINVDVVNPSGPLTVQLAEGSFTIKLDNGQFVAVENYINQQLVAMVLVRNDTAIPDPVIFEIKDVPYGTTKIEVPKGQSSTISLSNFNQADPNHVVTALVNGVTKAKNVNVWRGHEYDEGNSINYIRVTDADFGINPPVADITYEITADGGLGNPYSAVEYDTTTLTFTFSKKPDATPVIQKVSGAATFNSLTLQQTGDDRIFILQGITLVTAPQETLKFKTTTAGIDQSDHPVFVYKHQDPPAGFTGSKFQFRAVWVKYTLNGVLYTMIYKDGNWTYSGNNVLTLDEFKTQAAIPRNQNLRIDYHWQINEVHYENGSETNFPNSGYSKKTWELAQYGYFLVDEFSGANYVDLALNPGANQGITFKVGNKTNPHYAFDDGSQPWPFKTGIAFSPTDAKTTVWVNSGLGFMFPYQMNRGSNVIGPSNLTNQLPPGATLLGKTVEGLPQHYIPVYGVGVTTEVPVYGVQFDLWIKD
jgi:hypothetical protein